MPKKNIKVKPITDHNKVQIDVNLHLENDKKINPKKVFENYNPKILLEPISLKGKNSLEEIYGHMDNYGYEVKTYHQEGAKVPLYLFERNLK